MKIKYLIPGALFIGLVIAVVLIFNTNKNDFNITSNTFQLTYPLKLTKYTYVVGNDALTFFDYNRPEAKNGVVDAVDVEIGGVATLGSPEGMGKYNHSYLVSKKEVKGKIPMYQYLLQRDPPKGSGLSQMYTESHVYLVMNARLVYDVWFRTDYVSEDELVKIAQTFKSADLQENSATAAKTDGSQ